MKRFFTISFAAVLLMAACSRKAAPPAATPPPAPPPPPVEVAVTPAVIPADTLATKPVDAVAAGKLVYDGKCGRCHDLPKTTEFTAQRWEGIVDRMAPKARLNEDQKKQVMAFVQANAKAG